MALTSRMIYARIGNELEEILAKLNQKGFNESEAIRAGLQSLLQNLEAGVPADRYYREVQGSKGRQPARNPLSKGKKGQADTGATLQGDSGTPIQPLQSPTSPEMPA